MQWVALCRRGVLQVKWFKNRSLAFWVVAGLLALWLVGILAVVAGSWRLHEQEAVTELDNEAALIAGDLRRYLQQYEGIAAAVSELRTLRRVLSEPSPEGIETLNRFLQQTSRSLGSETIFVLNLRGVAIGASNYTDSDSFVGHDFSFRPYFKQAALGEPASYYAKGVVSGTRGYFFSAPIVNHDHVVGVAVVKISLEPLFQRMREEGHQFLLLGYDAVVFAASDPDWELRTLQRLPESQLQSLLSSRRYGDARLTPVVPSEGTDVFNARYLTLASSAVKYSFLVGRGLVPEAGWHLFTVMPRSELLRRTLRFSVYYSLVFGLLVLLVLYWHKRREVQRHVRDMNIELERRVTELTSELTSSNAELQDLVAHYQRTQSELESTQDQLVQTAKLALLGELSAGINHELNQPLLALQTYAENSIKLADRGKFETVKGNLGEILQITGTMHAIVSRFKVFARRSPPEPREVEINEVIGGALVIMKPLVHKASIRIAYQAPLQPVMIFCEPVQIQQVLVNLVTNAAEAMQESGQTEPGVIRILVAETPERIEIRVADNGPGIATDLLNRIFEPFFTTKSKGLGIGLALSRRILEALGGSLSAEPGSEGGSVFIVSLPRPGTGNAVTEVVTGEE